MELLAERVQHLERCAQYFQKRALPDLRRTVRHVLAPNAKLAARMVNKDGTPVINLKNMYAQAQALRTHVENLEQGKGSYPGNQVIREILASQGKVRDV